MKQQFDLSLWLKDKSRKVCTRDGYIAEIIYTNGKGKFPVIVIDPYEEETEPWQVTENGKLFYNGDDDKLDLFFADEENTELTEFEKELQTIISEASHWTSDDGSISTCCYFGDKEIKKISGQILDLARKELQPEFDKKLKEAYNQGGLDTQEEITKCLPKWKKSDRNWITNICDLATIVRCDGGDYEDYDSVVVSNRVDKDDYYIELGELLKLPKEE